MYLVFTELGFSVLVCYVYLVLPSFQKVSVPFYPVLASLPRLDLVFTEFYWVSKLICFPSQVTVIYKVLLDLDGL